MSEILRQQIDELYTKEMGFSLVVDMLVQARKPIIGHNMIYDVIYLYNQFIDDLPDTYAEFSKKVKESVSLILDYSGMSSSLVYMTTRWSHRRASTSLGLTWAKSTRSASQMKG